MSSLDPCRAGAIHHRIAPSTCLHLVKLLATETSTKPGGNIKISGVAFGARDTAEIEVTTAEALRKQYNVADSATATGIPIKIVGRNILNTSAISCSFLVEYASDQPPRRHCLASKQDFKEFLFNSRSASFDQKTAKWLVQDGAFVVSLKTARFAHLARTLPLAVAASML